MNADRLILSLLLSVIMVLTVATVVNALPAVMPLIIAEQGKPYGGMALFKFVIAADSTTLWSNDGSSMNCSEPDSFMEIQVTDGRFEVQLGKEPMRPLYEEVISYFDNPVLSVWVNTGSGFRKLPDVFLGDSNVNVLKEGEYQEASRNYHANVKSDLEIRDTPKIQRGSQSIAGKVEREQQELEGNHEPKNPDAIARERLLQKAGKDGEIPFNALLNAKKQVDAMPNRLSRDKDAGVWEWFWLGPGNIGGRIRSILIHPTTPSKIWVGSVSGGIWTTIDGGEHWNPCGDMMASLSISSLVMDPNNSNVIYAGTGEALGTGLGSQSGIPGAGIFKSTDCGNSWYQLPSTNNLTFRWVTRLAHHPTNSNTLYALTRDKRIIWRSFDGGTTWDSLYTFGSYPTDVKIHPTSPSWMIVGCVATTGVYTNTNGGYGSWICHTTGAPGKLPADGGRCEVAFSATNPMVMYACMNRNGGEIWLTNDGGVTWTLKNSGTEYMGTQGQWNNSIWVDPTDAGHILVGGIDIWESTNAGTDLQQISVWQNYHLPIFPSAHADNHVLINHPDFDGVTNTTIYCGNDGGIQMTTQLPPPGGIVWTNLAHDLGITQFFGGAAAPDGSVFTGGTQDNDKIVLHSPGPYWYQAETGDGGFAAVDFNNPSILYGEYVQLELRKSADGGMSWFDSYSGMEENVGLNSLVIAPFVMDPSNPHSLVAGGTKIWKTTNDADDWYQIRDTIPSKQKCSAIDIAKGDSYIIWVGYHEGNVARTVFGGGDWSRVDTCPPGLPNRWVCDIAISPHNSNEVFVTFGEYFSDNVWYTSNGGVTWNSRSGVAPYNLPTLPVTTVRWHPVNPNWVYIGTDLGVFASEDKGLTWSKDPSWDYNDGPINVEVSELFWQGDEWLCAATHGRGMYRCRPLDVVFVDAAAAPGGDGSFVHPYQTITQGLTAAGYGTTISIKGGTYHETPITLFKRGSITVTNGPVYIE